MTAKVIMGIHPDVSIDVLVACLTSTTAHMKEQMTLCASSNGIAIIFAPGEVEKRLHTLATVQTTWKPSVQEKEHSNAYKAWRNTINISPESYSLCTGFIKLFGQFQKQQGGSFGQIKTENDRVELCSPEPRPGHVVHTVTVRERKGLRNRKWIKCRRRKSSNLRMQSMLRKLFLFQRRTKMYDFDWTIQK